MAGSVQALSPHCKKVGSKKRCSSHEKFIINNKKKYCCPKKWSYHHSL